MDTPEIAARLYDILRSTQRARRPSPGRPPGAQREDLDQALGGLHDLIHALGTPVAPRLPPQIQANAAAFPAGRIAGTRAVVQHRRRIRAASIAALATPRGEREPGNADVLDLAAAVSARAHAEAHFRPAVLADVR